MLTESEKNLEIRVGILEGHHALVKADFAIDCFVVGLQRAELAFLQPSEGVNDVRAQVRVDIFRQVFARFGSVLRPVGEVANDLVALVGVAATHWSDILVVVLVAG